MKYIEKTEEPVSISEWKEANKNLKVNLDYRSFQRKPKLRDELVEEQFGLCAYTGMPVDEKRLGSFSEANLSYACHIEHMKPRKVCEEECVATHGPDSYGAVVCEDMDYHNLVAAIEVKRKPPAKCEIFGAAAHGHDLLPVLPTQPDCELKFHYDELGGVDPQAADDFDTEATIELLKLRHTSLSDYRRAAIQTFFPVDLQIDRDDLERIIEKTTLPASGRLPEFGFCIASYARSLL